jgi:hypothetical protein
MRLAPISSKETRGAKVEACASRKAAIASTREPQTTADQRPQRGGACGLRRQRGPNQALKGQGFTGSADALRLSAGDQIERKRDTRRKRQNDAPIDRTLKNDHRSHEPQAKAQCLARGHALPQQHGKDAAGRANEIGACCRRQRDPRPGKKNNGSSRLPATACAETAPRAAACGRAGIDTIAVAIGGTIGEAMAYLAQLRNSGE